MGGDLMTPAEWLNTDEFRGVIVLDPDGWDRLDYENSWSERITREEFSARLMKSTCIYPAGYWA